MEWVSSEQNLTYNNDFRLIIDIYIYTSMKHSLLQTFEKALALQSLHTLSDIRIKVFMLLF